MEQQAGPIGIFDSGYGGLSVFKEIRKRLPQYDYLYLGDNGRAPYGPRSFQTVYKYTKQCIDYLFRQNCHLIILACNTASAKALRTIQQNDLPKYGGQKKVLGVIRPTAEVVGSLSKTKKIGVLATSGTVASRSYEIEIKSFFPEVEVFQEACPMWVSLVENNAHESPEADGFIKKNVDNLFQKSSEIDSIILGCTHYPLLINKIRQFVPHDVNLIPQGKIVADSLADYLERHPEIKTLCSEHGQSRFLTTGSSGFFNRQAGIFLGEKVHSEFIRVT